MKEIKFRAKRIDMDRWVYGQYFTTPLTDENSGTTPDKGWFFLTGEPRHCIVQNMVAFVIDLNTLGQYTGLKDKNGKEIYEGDLLQDGKGVGEVKWVQEHCAFLIRTLNPHMYHYLESDERLTESEVIGNIYTNPELLEETP